MASPTAFDHLLQKQDDENVPLLSKLIVEGIGTFFLTMTVCITAVMGEAGDFAPFAIAGILMVMIYSGGHISGAHFNPAVTVAITLRGKCSVSHALGYILIQVIAGVLGALVGCYGLMSGTGSIEAADFSGMVMKVMTAEFLFTFALCYVILHVATSDEISENHFFGTAIATVVLAGALTVGSISLGAFNPAVSVMLLTVGKISILEIVYHIVPQLVAATLAAIVFKVL
mmetsp:Transcript_6512/g.8818  ORF Transcript_6512/g.8818 Transcript_6512/m.8818 type:complete len:229 (+) Transcript_6512:99-785(+)